MLWHWEKAQVTSHANTCHFIACAKKWKQLRGAKARTLSNGTGNIWHVFNTSRDLSDGSSSHRDESVHELLHATSAAWGLLQEPAKRCPATRVDGHCRAEWKLRSYQTCISELDLPHRNLPPWAVMTCSTANHPYIQLASVSYWFKTNLELISSKLDVRRVGKSSKLDRRDASRLFAVEISLYFRIFWSKLGLKGQGWESLWSMLCHWGKDQVISNANTCHFFACANNHKPIFWYEALQKWVIMTIS